MKKNIYERNDYNFLYDAELLEFIHSADWSEEVNLPRQPS